MLNQLVRIYNTMTTISTRGEDTLTMAECLKALRDVVMQMQQEINNQNDIAQNVEE